LMLFRFFDFDALRRAMRSPHHRKFTLPVLGFW
jgi:hypothetical protein